LPGALFNFHRLHLRDNLSSSFYFHFCCGEARGGGCRGKARE
jgi:hypothetical protein